MMIANFFAKMFPFWGPGNIQCEIFRYRLLEIVWSIGGAPEYHQAKFKRLRFYHDLQSKSNGQQTNLP